uniref:DUF445 family protein n=1 Tax=Halobacillus salinarum TaxID=2932257 RepID=UPI002110FAF3|nr:DUF445 family protein [Halobacillus salinarum]
MLRTLHVEISIPKAEKEISHWIELRYEELMGTYRNKSLNEILPERWINKTEKGTDQLADYIQLRIKEFLQSYEGRKKVTELVENYLMNQGLLGNMISSFMGSDSLTERMYPAILRYVSANETKEWLRSMLHKERQQLMDQPIETFEAKIGKSTIAHTLGRTVSKVLPLEEWLSRSVEEWTKPIRSKLLFELIPLVIDYLTKVLAERMERLMNSMHLAEIVQEEVESFQVERLEDMVLGISRREFKMITYLGALLGGVIGFLQGIIVLFV